MVNSSNASIYKLRFCLCVAIVIALVCANRSTAALFAYDAFGIVDAGSGNVYYDTGTPTANPDFSGQTFTITAGGLLRLGGQIKADGGNGNPASWGPDSATLFYRIDSGSFVSINLPYLTDFGTSGWKVEFEQASGVDIGSSLSVGTHSLSIYFQTHDNTQPADAFVGSSGAPYSATIQVVPEPLNVALTIFGAMIAGTYAIRRLVVRAR